MKKPVKRTRVREQADEEADVVLLNVYKKKPFGGGPKGFEKGNEENSFEFSSLPPSIPDLSMRVNEN
jgi:hypothetical protein